MSTTDTTIIEQSPSISSLSDQLSSLTQQLSTQPHNYDLHAAYIQALRAQQPRDVGTLTQAREQMSALFPLTEQLWTEWVQDEIDSTQAETQRAGAGERSDKHRYIESLFSRACQDYLLPDLWHRYVAYMQQCYVADLSSAVPTPTWSSSIAAVRLVFDQGAQALGFHRLEGEKLLSEYRSFENTILTQLLRYKQMKKLQRKIEQEEDNEDNNEDDEEDEDDEDEDDSEVATENASIMQQLDRIKSLYVCSFSAPLNGIDVAYHQYSQWVEKQGYDVEEEMTALFAQSQQDLEARTPYEQAITGVDSPVTTAGVVSTAYLNAWSNYLQFELSVSSKKQPQRVIILFERLLSQAFLHTDIWEQYIDFLREHYHHHHHHPHQLQHPEQQTEPTAIPSPPPANELLLSVHYRALRNLPQCGRFWCGWLLAAERLHKLRSELKQMYQRAVSTMEAHHSSDEEMIRVHLTMADYYHRLQQASSQRTTRRTGHNSRELSALTRECYKQASNRARYHNTATEAALPVECYVSIYLSWCQWEAKINEDIETARFVINHWLELQGDTEWRPWWEWTRLEIDMGNAPQARAVYRTAFERLAHTWNSEQICYEWMRFERSYGSLHDYDNAARRCEHQLRQIAEMRQASRAAAPLVQSTKPTRDRRKRKAQKKSTTKPTEAQAEEEPATQAVNNAAPSSTTSKQKRKRPDKGKQQPGATGPVNEHADRRENLVDQQVSAQQPPLHSSTSQDNAESMSQSEAKKRKTTSNGDGNQQQAMQNADAVVQDSAVPAVDSAAPATAVPSNNIDRPLRKKDRRKLEKKARQQQNQQRTPTHPHPAARIQLTSLVPRAVQTHTPHPTPAPAPASASVDSASTDNSVSVPAGKPMSNADFAAMFSR